MLKKFETIIPTTINAACEMYEEEDPRGEYVLVIAGLDKDIKKAEAIENWNQIPLKEHMDKYLKNGMEKKEAMKQVAADRGISKRDVYNELLKDV